MLSYRHAFHAGNHADILKHLTFYLVLDYYNRKEKPYICIDTHAGAGIYDLSDTYAQKTVEYESGIHRLYQASIQAPILRHFLVCLTQSNRGDQNYYPGSPAIAHNMMRQQDYLRLCEQHPTDSELLTQYMAQYSRIRYSISQQDGLRSALAWLPPPNHRAIILTDPSYEIKQDYYNIPKALQKMHRRCQESCFILWYPLLQRIEVADMKIALVHTFPTRHLQIELNIAKPTQQGMYGSGLFIINPPYLLHDQLNNVLPELTQLLAQDEYAHYTLTQIYS